VCSNIVRSQYTISSPSVSNLNPQSQTIPIPESQDATLQYDKERSNEMLLVAYHKMKRIFLNLADIDKEDPNQLMMCNLRVRISNY